MQPGGSEKQALLCSQSDQDQDQGPALNEDRKRSVLSARPRPPCRWACPSSLAVVLCALQVLSAVLYMETRWTVEELQLQLGGLTKKAECDDANEKNPEGGVKDSSEHLRVNLHTQQKLMAVESNIARVNQYVVSLKAGFENLKSEVEGSSQTQLSSLSDLVVQLKETAENDSSSVRAELSRLKSAFANVSRWMCGLEEHLTSHAQNFSFPALELIEGEMCNFTALADHLESRVNKGPDVPFAHIQEPSASMGLVHGFPNSSDLKPAHSPLARPRLQENNPSADILLMKIKPQPTTRDEYSDISQERGNSSEAVASGLEDGTSTELHREEGKPRSTFHGKNTTAPYESEMD